MNKAANVLGAWGLLGNATNLFVSIVFNGLWFLWPVRECVWLCVRPERNECCKVITCLKWWPNYDSLLQHAALQNQTPWNWLPAHLDLICVPLFFSPSLVGDSLLALALPPPTEKQALKMRVYKVSRYYIRDTKATFVFGDRNTKKKYFSLSQRERKIEWERNKENKEQETHFNILN